MARTHSVTDDEFRSVYFNVPEIVHNKFCHNKIRTALYVQEPLWIRAPIIFFFKGIIIEEFSKLANFYFLIIAFWQWYPETTNTNQFPTVAPALTFVVTAASFIKFRQDLERYSADKALNEASCQRYVDGSFVPAKWTQVKVGDFLKIDNREMLPADVVLISAFEPDPSNPVGACHVETKSLDVRRPRLAASYTRSLALRPATAAGRIFLAAAAAAAMDGVPLTCSSPRVPSCRARLTSRAARCPRSSRASAAAPWSPRYLRPFAGSGPRAAQFADAAWQRGVPAQHGSVALPPSLCPPCPLTDCTRALSTRDDHA